MTRFYWLRHPETSRYTGSINAIHKWHLPGVRCPECDITWASGLASYPSVDLSSLPEQAEYKKARPEPFDEFVRLRERVRPLVPPGAQLRPGTNFGPLVGTAMGIFSPLYLYFSDMPVVLREALEHLRAEGIQGLRAFPTELRVPSKKSPPDLLELEFPSHGRLHPDCTPPRPLPCPKCGRDSFTRPEEPILDAASLPADTDVFRLTDIESMLIGTERFVEAVRHLGLEEIAAQELPMR